MSGSLLQFELLAPDGVLVDEPIQSLQAADASGRFGILPNRERFFTILIPCVLSFVRQDGQRRYAAADGGALLLEDNHLSIAAREALVADRLEDVADAAAEMFKARQAQEHTARSAFVELELSLVQQLRKAERRP
jgi:F-type H+-transporting ATPase subunit epsilon